MKVNYRFGFNFPNTTQIQISNMSPTFFLFLTFTTIVTAQSPPATPLLSPATPLLPPATPAAPPPAPVSDSCNGIFLSYTYNSGAKIPPEIKTDPTQQPYKFKSTLLVLNNAAEELKSWRVFVGFQHNEYLVSVSNAIIADGTASLPGPVGNGTIFAGFPNADLQTAIETAGDLNQMSVKVEFVGTQFGVGAPDVPMPEDVFLVNDGYVCPTPTMQGTRVMDVCCMKDLNEITNITVPDQFLPRQNGDLTIMYDVIQTFESNYRASVTIENHSPLGRLDNWNLTWDWMRDEFIGDIKGAYPYTRDSSPCIFGPQGTFYQNMDFSTVLNCERRPTIIDLPLDMTNNTQLGMIPFCCRNGTILPPTLDPSKSKSAFQIQVYKMPPDINRSELIPPQNFKISGRLNPDYTCGPPVRVSPTQFPDPSGLPGPTAVSSWQVVCNITQTKTTIPKCCVSFSAYYNESVIPCPTCACGCRGISPGACSTTSPALFLPSQALLVPFENRTTLATAWAHIKHRPVPNPLPCSDHCGVSINWHLLTDYRNGWSSRLTIFNWEDAPFVDWFVAVQNDKFTPGFEKVYSFNGTVLDINDKNNTILMQGLPGLNYLVGEVDGANPDKDPRVPGKQQSVISFTKKNLPKIDVANGDGFPTKVFFNGEECALPGIIPISDSNRMRVSSLILAITFVLILLQR
ncbi:COBRA-like protein 7 [Rutidosis leptorrhynchoides]|uniref:COBRA-like protein 7 n=1 Tax=Rutidosis leptorrhynchoides TaxID=125765 RepID=UPI003A99762B